MTSERRNIIKQVVLKILEDSKIYTLPVVLDYILTQYGIAIISYKDAVYKGINIDTSANGYTAQKILNGEKKHIIFYNDSQIKRRIRWTIAHELGHIFLDHYDMDILIDDDIMEREAEYFAEQLLTPIAVVSEWGIKNAMGISRLCNVSIEAGKYRLADLRRHENYKSNYGYTSYDKMFLSQFSEMYFFEFAMEICA